ncbi:MAG: IMP cyclohydrolase [Candidatus Saccharicenans sp.]
MNKLRSYFSGLEYPGRFIIGGQLKDLDEVFLVYGITGRSVASQARRLVKKENGLWVEPTDPQLIVSGNPDLLIYPAMLFSTGRIAVSNGKQTTEIIRVLEKTMDPVLALTQALKDWKYEPDGPVFTPRISLAFAGGFCLAASIIKRGEFGTVIRNYFELPLIPGRGWLIMTYMGINADPVPAFLGEPILLEVPLKRAEEIAVELYESLNPTAGRKDFRVAVACLRATISEAEVQEIRIINRQEGK